MYKINEEKMFYDMADGVAVVINFTTGIYYGFDELSSVAFDALINGAAESSVLSALKALPGCPDDIDSKFNSFIEAIKEKEIIVGDGDGSEAPAFDPKLAESGFDLTVTDYSEVQDILLADPIHEVEPEMGWPFIKE